MKRRVRKTMPAIHEIIDALMVNAFSLGPDVFRILANVPIRPPIKPITHPAIPPIKPVFISSSFPGNSFMIQFYNPVSLTASSITLSASAFGSPETTG